MDFYQTYYAVRERSNIQNNVDSIDTEIDNISNKEFNTFTKILIIIVSIVIICFIGYFISDIYHLIHSRRKFFEKLSMIFSTVIVGLISIVIIPFIGLVFYGIIGFIISKIKPSKAKVEQISKLINNREELCQRINILNNSLENSIVPKHYRNLDAMQFMVTAFEHKRANTLTDLINLYEIHVESTNRDNKINELIKEKQNLTNQVSQLNESNKKLTDEVKRVRRKI